MWKEIKRLHMSYYSSHEGCLIRDEVKKAIILYPEQDKKIDMSSHPYSKLMEFIPLSIDGDVTKDRGFESLR